MISDKEVQDPEEGELVRYIPDHADHPLDPETSVGVVTNVGEVGIMVDFEDGSEVSKLCYRRNLIKLG